MAISRRKFDTYLLSILAVVLVSLNGCASDNPSLADRQAQEKRDARKAKQSRIERKLQAQMPRMYKKLAKKKGSVSPVTAAKVIFDVAKVSQVEISSSNKGAIASYTGTYYRAKKRQLSDERYDFRKNKAKVRVKEQKQFQKDFENSNEYHLDSAFQGSLAGLKADYVLTILAHFNVDIEIELENKSGPNRLGFINAKAVRNFCKDNGISPGEKLSLKQVHSLLTTI